MTETTGLSAVERFAEPTELEARQMLIDGRGRPAVIRFLVQKWLDSKQSAPSFAGYNPMGNWSKP